MSQHRQEKPPSVSGQHGSPAIEAAKRSELVIFARFHAREGDENALAAALRAELVASQAEPGCLGHQAYRSIRDPRLFFIHSRWAGGAAFGAHAELPHTLRFLERVQPLIDHELDVTRTVPLGYEGEPEE